MLGKVFDVKRFSLNDGQGIRTTFFLKGCPLRCLWCQNPEGIMSGNNFVVLRDKCIDGCFKCSEECKLYDKELILKNIMKYEEKCKLCSKCSQVCCTNAIKAYGNMISYEDIKNEIKKGIDIFKISNGGITFSGGEPFFQPEFLKYILLNIRRDFEDLNIAIETSLTTSIDIINDVKAYIDTFIVDIKCLSHELAEKYTGGNIECFMDNIIYLAKQNKKIMLRMVAIDKITFAEGNINQLYKLLDCIELKNIIRLEFLQYHNLAVGKYNELDKKFIMFEQANNESIISVKNYIEDKYNIKVEYLKI